MIGWNRTKHAEIDVPLVEIDVLLARADVVSMNLTLSDETRGFLSAERIARMKKGAYTSTPRAARWPTRPRSSPRSKADTSVTRVSTSSTPSRCRPIIRWPSSRT